MVTTSAGSAISAIERACSVPSLIGSLFIIFTFCSSKLFHKPISRMLFYASFGNMMSNVATLMSNSFTSRPDSAGCQTQAFLIETFMFADVFWALAMVSNVYLTFYCRFDGARLRKIEPIHIALCYGIPFIIAISFVFVRKDGARAYGNANLWCWLTVEWDAWQLATYGLIWLIIFIAFTIYVRVGFTIYKWRRRLNGFSNSNDLNTSSHAAPNQDPSGIAKTTSITITTLDFGPPDFDQPSRPTTRPEPVHSADVYAGPAPPVANPSEQPNIRSQHSDRTKRNPSDEAAVSYAKVAVLFFTAMLVTWIPASANRLYILIDGKASVQLGYVSAFVLPLQGFWNALIYYYTSRAACKQAIASLRTGSRRLEENDPNGSSFADRMNAADSNRKSYQLDRIRSSKRTHDSEDTESTTSLTARV
ncbi:G-protein coupled receptor [Fusarium heterosporum]|uniref:G-protein coupled receptor n=1 Tax=Fusarium heterosporum TaxID=42747 RepID=A0A8H5TST4_FUSHE|nr:G-protein coupled receptor [Fusarium heterosporum]